MEFTPLTTITGSITVLHNRFVLKITFGSDPLVVIDPNLPNNFVAFRALGIDALYRFATFRICAIDCFSSQLLN